jgi:hypothetical protein
MRFNIYATALAVTSMLGLTQLANAATVMSMSSAVMVSLSDVESQAQLAQQLQTAGYTNILLAANKPNTMYPHPELSPSETNVPGTAVRTGWNGTAEKDGKTYDVYVTFMHQ